MRRFRSVASLVFPILVAVLLALPIITLIWLAFSSPVDVWPHLLRHVLPGTALETTLLLLGVAIGAGVLGTGTAWLTAACSFPGLRFFSWALVLPLTVPTYISSYAYVELLDYSGPVQNLVRTIGSFATSRDYWFPDIRSLWGAALIFSLVLYPYVYLTVRVCFSTQGAAVLEVARSLGARPLRMFIRVALPIARPGLAAGLALALMETLNDIGAVEVLGIRTLTFAIYDTWLNRGSLPGAAQLACVMLVVIVLLIWLERMARRGRVISSTGRDFPPAPLELSGLRAAAAMIACALPILLGFALPLLVLATYASRRTEQAFEPSLLAATGGSLLLAVIASIATVIVSYGLLQLARLHKSTLLNRLVRMAAFGYAVPGTVIAVGVFIPLAALDNWLDGQLRAAFGLSTGLLFSGSLVALVYACTVRFVAIAYGPLEAGFQRVSPHMDMAARVLGSTPMRLVRDVHLPLMRKGLAAASLLVFVDTMKELPATLLLRPFGFETLATLVYTRASQGDVENAAFAGLAIVSIGILPMVLLGGVSLDPSGLRSKKKRGREPA